MATMPSQYYNRFDESQNYEQHLFVAGRGLQSAELNEIQSTAANRLRRVADALFKDGDVIRDAGVVVDQDTGDVQCQSGAVYLRGAVRGVQPAMLTIPVVGTVFVGLRLVEAVVTHAEDTDLLDPATGTRNYAEPGAARLQIVAVWSWDGDGQSGEFFPVYTVIDGLLTAKEAPPNLDAFTQALARYDRDSAGGTYIVSGLRVSKLPDANGIQYYSLAEGRAHVYGYSVEFQVARRLSHAAVPDLKVITNEPHLSSTSGAQRVNFDRSPGTSITELTITAEKTVTLTHGVFTGAQDPLPDTSVLSIQSVVQGVTTYTSGDDYQLTGGMVDWSPGGAEPAPGSTYQVTYRYLANVTPTAVDDDGFTVTGAVAGSLVMVSYSQKLPRFDRLCVNQFGEIVWIVGVSSDFNAQKPLVPDDLLSIATIYQNWRDTRQVLQDGVRMVPMPTLARVEDRMDFIVQLVAQQRLESNIHTREAGTKKGLFTDPFIDDSQRDAGTPQTGAIVNGMLVLPIDGEVHQVGTDIEAPTTLMYSHSVALEQLLRSGNMKINPYMAFAPVPATLTITPTVDRWTNVETKWASPTTIRFYDSGFTNNVFILNRSTTSVATANALIGVRRTEVETLREIQINYRITGFGPGEVLQALTFDGVARPTGGATADAQGVITGSFMIPAGVPSGNKLVSAVGGSGQMARATFSGQGTIERQTWQEQTTLTTTKWSSPPPPPLPPPVVFTDPLAQTFMLDSNMQVSGVDLWFAAASTTTTRVQIRGTSTGLPNAQVIAEAVIAPTSINVGGSSTRIVFPSPVSLIGGVEYAIVVLCDDAVGALSVAELGKFDSNAQRWITVQPYTVGVLLSSSNTSTWTPHQDRDMTFRLLRAAYTQTARSIPMGSISVTDATDFLLMSFAERPASVTSVDYELTLPDASVVVVSDGQPLRLSAPITGDVDVAARLRGSAAFSPVLYPGTQVVAGTLASTGDYVSRAVPAGPSVIVKVIFEAQVPSGATIDVFYKGQDVSDTWLPISVASTSPADDGFVEFIHQVAGVNEVTVQVKIVLNGTPAARPAVRDLRVIVLEDI